MSQTDADRASDDPSANPPAREDRRTFLKTLCAGAVAAAGGAAAMAAEPNQPDPDDTPVPGPMPAITLGGKTVSRLIAGGNPVEGYSHSSVNLSRHMVEYFTRERIAEFVQRCQRFGINTWQTSPSPRLREALGAMRDAGSNIQWICLYADHPSTPPLADVLALRPIAVVHHGGVTDDLFRKGQHDKVHDMVKRIKDAGVMAGVSSHDPNHVAYLAGSGWAFDFLMASFYHVSRPHEDIRSKLGTTTVGEPFFETDPDAMSKVIRGIDVTCLAFKLLAAGRLCNNARQVEQAFKSAFSRIKKTDAVIVGMYPRFKDEIAENVRLTLQYGRTG